MSLSSATSDEMTWMDELVPTLATTALAPSGSGVDEGTGTIPGVPDVPTDESEEEISWKSTDKEGDDDDDDDEGDDGEVENDDDDDEQDDDDVQDDDDQEDEVNDEDVQDEGSNDEQASDEKEFIHPSLSTHVEEDTRDEESFDSIPKTPKNTDDEGNGEENLGMNVDKEQGQDEEDEEDELYKDVNINLGRGVQMVDVHTTQEFEDSHVTLTSTPTSVDPLISGFPRDFFLRLISGYIGNPWLLLVASLSCYASIIATSKRADRLLALEVVVRCFPLAEVDNLGTAAAVGGVTVVSELLLVFRTLALGLAGIAHVATA
nr:hypothetical protein [Tanacetum cinerariifolium]